MSILQYIYDHYVMLTELIGLWAMLSLGVHLSKKTIDATRTSIMLIVIESIVWSIEKWTQSHDGYVLLRAILTSCVYCIHPVIVVSIIEMAVPVKKHKGLLLAPLFVYTPIVFTSQWTHAIFFISDENTWHGNDLFSVLPYVVFTAYVAVFVILFFLEFIRYNWQTVMGVVYIVAVSLLGVYVNKIMDASNDFSTLFSSVIVLYYLFAYMHMSKIDSMTGMMNRQTFYHDTAEVSKKLSGLCSVDMNELKWINDSQGHEAGDKAIKTVAECLMKKYAVSKNSYRVGGDEFMILYYDKSEEDIKNDIVRMREELAKTPYVCAFGYCMAEAGKSFDEIMRDADKSMYDDKAEIKRAVLAAGGKLHRRSGDR
ncbi:MAG: GGDEF domain-containing protein [Lachnospiraceae bacterium]|nr:GGDEF domain-containing protein [Lachnospiraceae bacterium]